MTTEQVKLKPCPFCGGEARLGNWATDFVRCKECRAEQIGLTPAEAIAAWNTRPNPPSPDAGERREAIAPYLDGARRALERRKEKYPHDWQVGAFAVGYDLLDYFLALSLSTRCRYRDGAEGADRGDVASRGRCHVPCRQSRRPLDRESVGCLVHHARRIPGQARSPANWCRKCTGSFTVAPTGRGSMTETKTVEVSAMQDKRRLVLIERIGTVADLAASKPLEGELGDVAYDLLREAAAQISSDRHRLASQSLSSDIEAERDRLRLETKAVWRCAIGDVTGALDILKNRWVNSKRKAEREAGATLSGVLNLIWGARSPAAGTYDEASENGKDLQKRVAAALKETPNVG